MLEEHVQILPGKVVLVPTSVSTVCGPTPNYVLAADNHLEQALGNIMFSCNVTGSDEYCCNEDCSCTENGQNQVVSFTGTPYTLTVIGVEGTTYPNPSATTSRAASTSPASSSATATSSSSLIVSASTVAAATSGTTAAGAASASALSSSSGGSSDAVVIGVGVGVGVGGALLLGGLIAFVLLRRRKARAQKTTQPMADTKDSLPGYTSEGQGYTGGAGTPYQQTAAAPMPPHQYSQTDNVSELGHSDTHGRSEMAGEHGRPPAELSG